MKLQFLSRDFRKKKKDKISNFIKIIPLGAELFNEDGRRDMTKLIFAFRTFSKVPQNQYISTLIFLLVGPNLIGV
jgi:hypothetical protein